MSHLNEQKKSNILVKRQQTLSNLEKTIQITNTEKNGQKKTILIVKKVGLHRK